MKLNKFKMSLMKKKKEDLINDETLTTIFEKN